MFFYIWDRNSKALASKKMESNALLYNNRFKNKKSNNGTFIHKGWCCNRYEPGEHKIGNIKQKLEVSRLFHNDLAKESFENIPQADNPWSKSQLIALQK